MSPALIRGKYDRELPPEPAEALRAALALDMDVVLGTLVVVGLVALGILFRLVP